MDESSSSPTSLLSRMSLSSSGPSVQQKPSLAAGDGKIASTSSRLLDIAQSSVLAVQQQQQQKSGGDTNNVAGNDADVNDDHDAVQREHGGIPQQLLTMIEQTQRSHAYYDIIGQGLEEEKALFLDALVVGHMLDAETACEERVVNIFKPLNYQQTIDLVMALLEKLQTEPLAQVQDKALNISSFLKLTLKKQKQMLDQKAKDGEGNEQKDARAVNGDAGGGDAAAGGGKQIRKQPPQRPKLEDRVKELCEKTGYKHEVKETERIYSLPSGSNVARPVGCEIYIGRLPDYAYEDVLVPVLEQCGKLYQLRLMTYRGSNALRPFCFVTYTTKDECRRAISLLNGKRVHFGGEGGGKRPILVASWAINRIYIGSIPKEKTKEEIMLDFSKELSGIVDCFVYAGAGEAENNRGFCFLEFITHEQAREALRQIQMGKFKPYPGRLFTDWAFLQPEPTEEQMGRVRVLYIGNLKQDRTDDELTKLFAAYPDFDKFQRHASYAFVHFKKRESALQAMEALQGKVVQGQPLEIELAKPQQRSSNSSSSYGNGSGSGGGGYYGGSANGGGYYAGGNGYYNNYYYQQHQPARGGQYQTPPYYGYTSNYSTSSKRGGGSGDAGRASHYAGGGYYGGYGGYPSAGIVYGHAGGMQPAVYGAAGPSPTPSAYYPVAAAPWGWGYAHGYEYGPPGGYAHHAGGTNQYYNYYGGGGGGSKPVGGSARGGRAGARASAATAAGGKQQQQQKPPQVDGVAGSSSSSPNTTTIAAAVNGSGAAAAAPPPRKALDNNNAGQQQSASRTDAQHIMRAPLVPLGGQAGAAGSGDYRLDSGANNSGAQQHQRGGGGRQQQQQQQYLGPPHYYAGVMYQPLPPPPAHAYGGWGVGEPTAAASTKYHFNTSHTPRFPGMQSFRTTNAAPSSSFQQQHHQQRNPLKGGYNYRNGNAAVGARNDAK